MSELKKILQASADRSDKAGGALSADLIARLEIYRRRQFTIFVVIEVVIILAVAGCAWYLVTHPAQTMAMKTLAGLIGLGSGGGLEIARRIWKEWAQADLLLLMISEASEAQVKALVDRLLKAL